jgi:hypothetical protein
MYRYVKCLNVNVLHNLFKVTLTIYMWRGHSQHKIKIPTIEISNSQSVIQIAHWIVIVAFGRSHFSKIRINILGIMITSLSVVSGNFYTQIKHIMLFML